MNLRLNALSALGVLILGACGSPSNSPSPTSAPPPTANIKPPTSIGAGEGELDLVLWDGYADPSWVNPFTQQYGCKVIQHPAGSSEEMVSLMKDGGGGQWDMVSASGDAGLRLIYGGDVVPMNVNLIPDWQNFGDPFKSPAYNTVNGVHYGVSLQWGPNTLLYSTRKFPNKPTSWSVLYDPANAGLITVPDQTIYIADAALYLSKTQPDLGIKDPYELTQKQFDASVTLLKQQHPLVKEYWALATDEISLFQNGAVVAGAAWPYQTVQLKLAGAAVDETIPEEGATAWADSWMVARKAPHPNCAYLWDKWVSTPKVQAMQALSFGETPVNTRACAEMEALQGGSCAQYHGDQTSSSYFSALKFWKTPLADCGNGHSNCVPYDQWVQAWTAIRG